jgi:hypothetical protein
MYNFMNAPRLQLLLLPGEKRVLQFNPENIEQIEAEFNEKRLRDINTE